MAYFGAACLEPQPEAGYEYMGLRNAGNLQFFVVVFVVSVFSCTDEDPGAGPCLPVPVPTAQ